MTEDSVRYESDSASELKQILCYDYTMGNCQKGNSCQFSHDNSQKAPEMSFWTGFSTEKKEQFIQPVREKTQSFNQRQKICQKFLDALIQGKFYSKWKCEIKECQDLHSLPTGYIIRKQKQGKEKNIKAEPQVQMRQKQQNSNPIQEIYQQQERNKNDQQSLCQQKPKKVENLQLFDSIIINQNEQTQQQQNHFQTNMCQNPSQPIFSNLGTEGNPKQQIKPQQNNTQKYIAKQVGIRME